MSILVDKKFALVLGGGSARGIIHLGVIKWLVEHNLRPKVIAGTSAGAIIGAFYAAGLEIDRIENIIASLRIRKFLDLDPLARGGFIRGHKVEKYLKNILGRIQFSDLQVKLKINATDFNTGEEIVFTKGRLVPAVRASMNIPIIFSPYHYRGKLLVDGGVVNNLPINQVINYQVDKFVVVNPYFSGNWVGKDRKKSHNIWEVTERTIKLYSMSRYRRELIALPNKIYIQYHNPKVAVYDFHKVKQIVRDGYQLAEKYLGG